MVVDESLKEREVQVVVTAEFVHGWGRPELLVVADQDQVFAALGQGGHHVGFQHLTTQSSDNVCRCFCPPSVPISVNRLTKEVCKCVSVRVCTCLSLCL